MKAIYDEQTQGLIDQLKEMIDSRTSQLSKSFKEKSSNIVIYCDENEMKVLLSDPILKRYNEELTRIYSIAIPLRYEV